MKVRIDIYTDNKVLASEMFVELCDYVGDNNLNLQTNNYISKPLFNITVSLILSTEVLEILQKYENLGFSDDYSVFED